MRAKIIIALVLLMFQANLFAQTFVKPVAPPKANSFAGTLSFLSSDWMEGREAGAKGGFMAADYIASMMQLFGLTPFVDQLQPGKKSNMRRGYFQDFEVLRYKTENSRLAFIQGSGSAQSAFQFSQGIDYNLKSGPNSMEAEAQLVFAGYGISACEAGYDDYKGLDVEGKIVVVLPGLPGHADTVSAAWRKLSKSLPEDAADIENKIRTAGKHKAIALIIAATDGNIEPYSISQINKDVANHVMNSKKPEEPVYDDPDYCLPGDTAETVLPCFILSSAATRQIFSGTGIDPVNFEKKVARLSAPASIPLKGKSVRFSVAVKAESLRVRNVIGIIHGIDTTRNIIVGAHYDHLGMRNGSIYNGSDDNASGASGMIALAKTWSENGVQPPCNIIFASWTAEEKGLLGSQYFAQHKDKQAGNILLYINMDMISRSAPEDTSKRIISVGTRTADELLRGIARKSNSTLARPFVLDLWDVTGHTGSDYASFTALNIPVMTFFSGFHEDYHTPRDISPKADLQKMGDVLKIVNGCLQDYLELVKVK